jgi:hypothetical protein|tara:strand:- start:987 stop:1613 length:627 start_codon:yes stop_codon:yes gene_type:complete
MNSYKSLQNIAPNINLPTINPLTYCTGDDLDIRFTHGGHADTYGQYSRPCQLYVPDYCSQGWDQFCEVMSQNTNRQFPNNYNFCEKNCQNLNFGEALIHNTASRKYLVKMHNGEKKYEPFDPTVANSPMISYWTSNNQNLIPEYEVNPQTIDQDVVMDKILDKPDIAINILINIYNTMKRKNKLSLLKNTKLGTFYQSQPYFIQKGGI